MLRNLDDGRHFEIASGANQGQVYHNTAKEEIDQSRTFGGRSVKLDHGHYKSFAVIGRFEIEQATLIKVQVGVYGQASKQV